jgi:osmotically-inducible protein OsmY
MRAFLFSLLASLAFSVTITACVPVVLGTATATGVSIAQERTVGDAVDDATLWTKINNDLLQKDVNLFGKVSVKVTEGRVLLTGSVSQPQHRVEAVRIAWQQRGVKEVINELTIENTSGTQAMQQYGNDAWITTQLKSKLLFNKDIRSVNYSVDTVAGVVYLMGIAQDKQELDRVTDIAGTIKYVQKVVSFVRIKNAPLRQVNQIY